MKMTDSETPRNPKRALELSGAARDRRRVGGRQVHFPNRAAQRFEPVLQAVAPRHLSAQADLPLPVEAVDPGCGPGLFDRNDAVKPHEPAAPASHVETGNRVRVAPVLLLKPQLHV